MAVIVTHAKVAGNPEVPRLDHTDWNADHVITGLTKAEVGLDSVDNTSDADKPVSTATQTALDGKQDTLVSGTNIKTVNSTSLLGSGNISITAGVWGAITGTLADQTDLNSALGGKQATLVSGTNIKTVNGNSLLGSGDVSIASAVAWGAITGTLADQTDLNSALGGKEPTITAGTTAQYWRGDKSWQTLDKSAVGLGNVANADTTTTANITDSTNKRFITDAQQTVLGNTSGTNTGDQTTITGNAGTATALQTGRTIAITGDLSYTSPSFNGSANVTAAGTLATVNSNTGSFGSATQVATFTVNGKGLITAAANATISVPATAISDSTTAGRSMLTAASATAQTALLDTVTSGAKGLAPASGGGTTNFLRADGTWAAPPGGGGGADLGVIQQFCFCNFGM